MEWYIECGGKKNGRFTRNIFIKPDEIDTVKDRFDGDTYISTFMYNDRKIEDSLLYGPLYIDLDLDLDSEESFKKLKVDLNIVANTLNVIYKVKHEYIRIYFSGGKGFHVVINPKVFGITPSKNLNENYKKIAMDINEYTESKCIDPKIYDRRRLIRLSGTINEKTGLYKLPVSLKQVNSMKLSDMLDYAKEYKPYVFPDIYTSSEASNAYKENLEKLSVKKQEKRSNNKVRISNKRKLPDVPCIKRIIEEGVSEGCRNNTSVALASCILQNGFSLEEAINILEEWNESRNDPPLSDTEINDTANSAYKFLLADKVFGCGAFKTLGYCEEKGCRIKKL